ncbi:MAG: T9SS type A sorting domain-containing protein [candidate division WOR-3 bacterium]|nr:MAG: T9SS type A sorting domain-containing protein [candidate division WOR-3 bacterium]
MKKTLILLCLMVVGLFAYRPFVDMPPDYQGNTGYSLPYTGNRASPGIEVGITDYDFQNNGSLGRYVWLTGAGGMHFYWTYSFGATGTNRRAYYNYYFPPSYWLGAMPMDTAQSRMGAMETMSDGRALGSAHASVTGGYATRVYLDAAEGAGTFTTKDLPDAGATTTPIWPKQCVDQNDNIYAVATVNGGTHAFWTKSTDEGDTWLPWDSVINTTNAGPIPLRLADYYLQAGRESWASSHASNWTMLANSSGDLLSKVCWETDGNNWYFDTIWTWTPTDSVFPWFWTSVVYDNNYYAHVVFDVQDTAASGGGAQQSGWASQIWHWNQETDAITPVDGGMGWYFTNPGPGYNHGTVSEPQMCIDRATGTLYCTWTYADSLDVAANGYINEDIWGARSTDNGATWIDHHNITNSPTPGAATGFCDADRWQTLAEETVGSDILLFYMNDKEAGAAAFGDATAYTDNPMLFYQYTWPGIEENNTETPRRLSLTAAPNPFVRNTVLSYALPTAGNVSIKLYSVDGRLVQTVQDGRQDAGVYTANVDARQLANGTYFVVLDAANEKVTKSLVVVR